ncbi:MAG: hypothetical protein VB111_10225 [Clostridiaceae bacterium]|nr:hypothetical protein [Clostridiaceae bacterium]
MRDFFRLCDPVHFVFPIDGDCLCAYDGKERDGALVVNLRIAAPKNAKLTVNGVPAVYRGDTREFCVDYPLRTFRNTLVAIDAANGYHAEIVVYRFREAVGKTRFTVDDTVVVFYDLAKKRYDSIFDHPFLNCFKRAHDLYGTVTNLNIYYNYDADSACDFSAHKDYFNLSMMPDCYRAEWEANADWLTLSYHAHNNYPSMPFMTQSADFVGESIRKTHAEIRRFAGEASLSPATTQHFGNGYAEQLRAFRENGYRIQFASFRVLDDTAPYLSYYGADGLPAHIRGDGLDAYDHTAGKGTTVKHAATGRDFWHDNREDITFCRTDMVLNTIELSRVGPWLAEFIRIPERSGYLTPMIHEEYFYPDYFNYIPDCTERVLAACRFAYEHGYRAAKPEEIVLEK